MTIRRSCLLATVSFALLVPLNCQAAQPTGRASREDLIAAAREIMKEARYCALITLDTAGRPRVRAMEPFEPEENLVVWLATKPNTRKVEQIERDPRVSLYYSTGGDGYVAIQGTARLVDDPVEKSRRWKEGWEEYYPDRDKAYLLIAVTPETLEVVSYRRNLVGDPDNWKPPSISFP